MHLAYLASRGQPLLPLSELEERSCTPWTRATASSSELQPIKSARLPAPVPASSLSLATRVVEGEFRFQSNVVRVAPLPPSAPRPRAPPVFCFLVSTFQFPLLGDFMLNSAAQDTTQTRSEPVRWTPLVVVSFSICSSDSDSQRPSLHSHRSSPSFPFLHRGSGKFFEFLRR